MPERDNFSERANLLALFIQNKSRNINGSRLVSTSLSITTAIPKPIGAISTTSIQPAKKENMTTLPMLEDLHRCSRALNVSKNSLSINRDTIVEVSRRADTFLEKIKPFIPQFSSKYKNPCWTAEKLSVSSSHMKKILHPFFFDTSRRVKPGMEIKFSRYLRKPAKNNSTNRTKVLCLPYFFLAGFPKSASTTLHHVLSELPGVVAPEGKEPHWWTRVLSLSNSKKFDPEYIPIAFMAYIYFFDTISSRLDKKPNQAKTDVMNLITYDGSQCTLWDSNFFYRDQDFCAMPAVMSRVLPNAKFIVVMRNPVTRLYSHFKYSCKLQYGKLEKWPVEMREKGTALFHEQVTKDIMAFNDCLETKSAFECASSSIVQHSHSNESSNCGRVQHRLAIGLYVIHIKKWLQFYPQENFLFLRMEDLTRNARETIHKITNFLDLPSPSVAMQGEELFERENALRGISRPMLEKTKSVLDNFYGPFNKALATLLNDDRYLWND